MPRHTSYFPHESMQTPLANPDLATDEKHSTPDDGAKSLSTDHNGRELELGPRSTYIASPAAAALSQDHRDYLLKRHGTLDLDPLPTSDPADPYNWPQWKKTANLTCVAFHVSPPHRPLTEAVLTFSRL